MTDNTHTQLSSGGKFYIVATPIGNLADMVPRAVEVLQSVDLIAAEDTRHSKRLMQHFNITTHLIAYHDHSGTNVVQSILDKILAGQDVALISDAGTPLVSDPGYRIVDAAISAGIKVIPIPGASALITALSAAGLPSNRFIFEGFLPVKQLARINYLKTLSHETRTLIFYEAPHRLLSCLQDMKLVFGDSRQSVLARELTKKFETIKRASISDLCAWVERDNNQQRGEAVLLVHGAAESDASDEQAYRVFDVLVEELPLKQAAALAARITGMKKNHIYQYGLERKKTK